MCVEDGRTPYCHGRLLVSRQMRDWGFVEPGSSVDVDGVDDIV